MRLAQKEPFYMSSKQTELTQSTLSLAGLSHEDVERLAEDVAAADAAAAASQHDRVKSGRRRCATVLPGDLENQMIMYEATAAASKARLTEAKEDGEVDRVMKDLKRASVVWLGRSGEEWEYFL